MRVDTQPVPDVRVAAWGRRVRPEKDDNSKLVNRGSNVNFTNGRGLNTRPLGYESHALFITGYSLRTSIVLKPNLSYKRIAGLFGETLSEMAG